MLISSASNWFAWQWFKNNQKGWDLRAPSFCQRKQARKYRHTTLERRAGGVICACATTIYIIHLDSHAHNHNESQLSNDKERDQVVWEAGRCCWRTHGMLIFISFIMWCVSLSLSPPRVAVAATKVKTPFIRSCLHPFLIMMLIWFEISIKFFCQRSIRKH
jgi:hypothetical protein